MRRGLFLFFILLLSASSFADHTPIGYTQWRDTVNNQTIAHVGQVVQNYQKADGEWANISNHFVAEGDSVLIADSAVLKVRVNKDGTSSATYLDSFTVTQNLVGVGWLNVATKKRSWIDKTMNFNNVSVVDNVMEWSNVSPGIDYWVIKDNASLQHNIRFKKGFLDSAVALYSQRADSLDLALANVMEYTFSSNIDNADSAIGDVDRRTLKKFIQHTFELSRQQLYWTNDTSNVRTRKTIPVKQRWVKKNGKHYMVEYVMMSDVNRIHEANPNSVIWHNAVANITTPDFEEAISRTDAGDRSYGGSTYMSMFSGWNTPIRCLDLNNELGGAGYTVQACSLVVKATAHSSNGDAEIKRLFKYSWEHGTGDAVQVTEGSQVATTGNNFENSNSLVWATEWGARCEKDNGVENKLDAGTCTDARADRKATAEVSITFTGTSGGKNSDGWYFADLTSLAQANASSAMPDSLNIILVPDGSVDATLASSEHGTGGNRPYFIFHYTVAGGGGNDRRRKILMKKHIGVSDEIEDDTWLVDYSKPTITNTK